MDRHTLDVVAMPSWTAGRPASFARFPSITVPLGAYSAGDTYKPVAESFADQPKLLGPGRPYGITFIARRFEEIQLLQVAYAFEQATKIREKIKPIVCPTFQLEDVMETNGH